MLKYKLMKLIISFLPLAILLEFTAAYLLRGYIQIDIVVIVLVILLIGLDVKPYVMSFVFLVSWFSTQFAIINESCENSFPTLFLLACRILLILQILDNGFHEVISGFSTNSSTSQDQNLSQKQKTLDDSNLPKNFDRKVTLS
ncbi:hypothetical protein RDI58_014901 [Solanum bulbocastanum]|uniref:Uncharacterized protein n=1 Tax=Solanum bulbocastanum TaxID=147425 RepID=A0AAN8TJ47_SOLBU